MSKIRIIMAQLNFTVGDIDGNKKKIIDAIQTTTKQPDSDIIVFPELALTGYPPEDLLTRLDFHETYEKALDEIRLAAKDIMVIIGHPHRHQGLIYNCASILHNGEVIKPYFKQFLPNYGVFDEKRYFQKGKESCVFHCKDIPIGLTICEDIWFPAPAQGCKAHGAKLIISINASPFDIFKLQEREKVLQLRIVENQLPIMYVHSVGGQDEVVFDGRSMVLDQNGETKVLAPVFEETLMSVDFEYQNDTVQIKTQNIYPFLSREARIYKALTTSLHDYVTKNGFTQVVLGLSGGIDSALTLAIAVDALGVENVKPIIMPSRFTAEISIEDSIALAKNLGVEHRIISIEPAFETFLNLLEDAFKNTKTDVTEENMQSRCRAVILMALANKFNYLLLATGNKSEMAVGYATLYGDMAGGFSVLKDAYKTLVYDLARYRNQVKHVIPERIINRPPTAELRENQVDEDSLPPYEILDKILEQYVEQAKGPEEIIQAGFDPHIVHHIVYLVDRNEYKRRQAPPGPKITTRAFGRDRRFPVTSGYTVDLG